MKKLLTSLILAAAGLFAVESQASHRPTDDYFRLIDTTRMELVDNLLPTTGSYIRGINPQAFSGEGLPVNTSTYWYVKGGSSWQWYYTPVVIEGLLDRGGNSLDTKKFTHTIKTETEVLPVTIISTNTITATVGSIETTTQLTATITSSKTVAYTVMELERIIKSHTLRAELDTIAELEKISHRADIDLFDFGIGCFESRIGCTPNHYREALRGRDRVIFGTALEHLEECVVDALGAGTILSTKQEVLNLALYVRGAIMYHRRQDVNGQMMIILKYRQSNFHRNTYEKVCDYLQTRDWNGRIPAGIRGADIVQNAHRTYERH